MGFERFFDRLRFLLERLMIRGPHYQLLLVALMIALISVFGGAVVMVGAGGFDSLGDAVWWAFLRLSDPGYLGDDVGVLRRIVSTILTVLGYVVFLGTLVAIMTRWLLATMRRLESGVTPIAASNHIAIIGWTGRTPALVAELLGSEARVQRFLARHGARRLQIAILAEDVTPEHVIELRDRAGDLWNARRVTLRSGSRLRPEHLERIDVLHASAVLLPAEDAPQMQVEEVDAHTIKTLLSLSNHPLVREGYELPFAAVEVRDARKIAIAKQAYVGQAEIIASDATISRLIAQNVRHAGLSHIYNELLTHSEGSEFYVRDPESLVGRTFDSALVAFPDAVLLGVVRPSRTSFIPHLNPPPGFVIEQGDRLVLLSDAFESTEPDFAFAKEQSAHPFERGMPGVTRDDGEAEHRLLILGWNHKLPSLMAEFASYTGERFAINIVSVSPAAERTEEIERYGVPMRNLTLRHIQADYNHLPELNGVEPWTYDRIILVSSGRMATSEDADARTLQGYLLLQHLFSERGAAERRPGVLVELLDAENFGLLAGRPGEVLISPLIVSHMLAQVALRRELRAVFEELFTAGGAEITFIAAAEYGVTDRAITFRELQRLAWSRGETLVGVYKHAKAGASTAKPMLNPPSDSEWRLSNDDELVTIVTMR